MRLLRCSKEGTRIHFETEEIELISSLVGQLVELIMDEAPGCRGAGVRDDVEDPEEDLFERLSKEMGDLSRPSALSFGADPVIVRLFPDAYPDDEEASRDFYHYTAQEQYDDKLRACYQVMNDLTDCESDGFCDITSDNFLAWLKTLTNLRLALAVRLGITTEADSHAIAELSDDDPRSWVFSIYEWLGWAQESLLAARYV